MFCINCGNKLTKNDDFCPSCGTPKEETKKAQAEIAPGGYQPNPIGYNQPAPGNAVSTAGMVLGILSSFVFSFEMIGFMVITSINRIHIDESESEYAYYAALIFELLPFIIAIIGMSLSIAGMVKRSNGRNVSGLILSIVAIVEAILLFILLLSLVE